MQCLGQSQYDDVKRNVLSCNACQRRFDQNKDFLNVHGQLNRAALRNDANLNDVNDLVSKIGSLFIFMFSVWMLLGRCFTNR